MIIYSANRLNKKLLKIFSILCALIIPLLVTGPFLPDLLISSFSLWFLYYTLKNKIYKIYNNIYFYFFISFWLVCILSSILSDHIIFSLKTSLFYVRIGIFALFISYLINESKKILDYFYYAIIITFSSLIIDGFFQYFNGINLFGLPIQDKFTGVRISSFFGEELILGSYLARLSPLFLGLFIIRPNKNFFEICFICVLFILIYILVFISGERASFVLLNFSIIFIIIFTSNYKLLKFFIFILSFFLILFLTFKDQKLYNRYVTFTFENLKDKSSDLNSSSINIFSKEHESLIKTGWKMFLDKPILGHGPKSFRLKCKMYGKDDLSCNTHPHNFYIQLLAETGVVGFLFLATLFFYFIYIVFRILYNFILNKKNLYSDYQISLLAGLLITIWPLTSNGNIFNNYLMIIYSLQIGFFKKNF